MPRQLNGDESPDPSVPSPNSSRHPEPPRVWGLSPGASVQAHVREILLLFESEEHDSQQTTPTYDGLSITDTVEGHSEIRTHRTAGHKVVEVDRVIRVPPGASSSDALDGVAYDVATAAAEGFHVTLLAASPTSLEESIGVMLEGSDGTPQVVSVALGYVMDLFSTDAASIDVSAFCIKPTSGIIIDLLGGKPGAMKTVESLHYRTKWGLTGVARTQVINNVEDLVLLPTAAAAIEAVGQDEDSFVVIQCRIRRLQTLRSSTVSGDFDIVQSVCFACLPPTPWRSRDVSCRFTFSESAMPLEAAESFVNGYIAAKPTSPSEDDSKQIMCVQALHGVLREAFAGPVISTVIIPTRVSDLANFIDVNDAVREFTKLRAASSRVVHPASALEAAAIAAAETRRRDAEMATAAVVREFNDPVVLLDRNTFNVVAVSPRAAALVPPETVVMELCRLGRGGILTAAEALLIASEADLPQLHVRGGSNMIRRCIEIGEHYILIYLDVPADAVADKIAPDPLRERRQKAERVLNDRKPRETSCGCIVS